MICFLTSRVDDTETGILLSANRFADELRNHFPNPCWALDICSDPEDAEKMAAVFDLLLGDNLEGRKNHISEHGSEFLDLADIS